MKKGLVAVLALILISGFFLWMFSNNQAGTSDISTPNSEPTQEVAVSENWETYTHETFGYTISYPVGYQVESNGDYSILILKTIKQPGFGPANFIYVSIVPPGQSTNEGEIYNFNPVQFNKLMDAGIGENVSLADTDQPDLNTWFTYTRVDDTEVDGHPVKRFENSKPWEFPTGTTELRLIFENNGYIYVMGYYYGGEEVSEPMDPREAFGIISSFKIN